VDSGLTPFYATPLINLNVMSAGEANQYSQQWFDHFHAGISGERTLRETDFLATQLPLPEFRRVADVCCGIGRHARALSHRGYRVTGVERDAAALTRARELAGGVDYERADVRDWRPETGSFDAVIVMAQSFGYFDAAANFAVLQRLAGALRSGGRLVLDLWNPRFFAVLQGVREFVLPQGVVRETKHVAGERLEVTLDYPCGSSEEFSWQLFSPSGLSDFVVPAGLSLLRFSAGFGTSPPSDDIPGWQCVLERNG
jgi:SAM-dependent methyltransferase